MLKSIFWHPFCHPDSLILATFLLLNAACYDSNFSSPRQSPFVYISYPMRSAETDNKRWWAASRGTPILRNIPRCVCVCVCRTIIFASLVVARWCLERKQCEKFLFFFFFFFTFAVRVNPIWNKMKKKFTVWAKFKWEPYFFHYFGVSRGIRCLI